MLPRCVASHGGERPGATPRPCPIGARSGGPIPRRVGHPWDNRCQFIISGTLKGNDELTHCLLRGMKLTPIAFFSGTLKGNDELTPIALTPIAFYGSSIPSRSSSSSNGLMRSPFNAVWMAGWYISILKPWKSRTQGRANSVIISATGSAISIVLIPSR